MSTPDEVARKRSFWTHPYAWVTSTYYAEGYPYAIVNNLAEVMFKEMGASLQAIGLTALFHLPWNLKFLWGPFVDEYETKRRWLLVTEIVLSVLLVVLAFLVGVTTMLGAISLVFLVVAVFAATHDIAIDGYYLEALDAKGQSRFVGYRAAAYRLASLTVRGPLLVVIGVTGWSLGLLVAAGVFVALTAFHLAALPRVESRKLPIVVLVRRLVSRKVVLVAAALALAIVLVRELGVVGFVVVNVREGIQAVPALASLGATGWIGLALLLLLALMPIAFPWVWRAIERSQSHYARAFVTFRRQDRIGVALAYVMLFRTGESFLEKMRYPFFSDEGGMDLETYGIVNGTVGLLAVFVATILGGWLIARDGLRRWMWPFMLSQNLLNLAYAAVAFAPDPRALGLPVLTLVITIEHFGAGLGTAVLMVYIMRCCDPAHRAAHMAIVTALMSVGFTLAGAASGFLAVALGYGPYFMLTFIMTVPSMVLAFFVPYVDGRPSDPAAEA